LGGKKKDGHDVQKGAVGVLPDQKEGTTVLVNHSKMKCPIAEAFPEYWENTSSSSARGKKKGAAASFVRKEKAKKGKPGFQGKLGRSQGRPYSPMAKKNGSAVRTGEKKKPDRCRQISLWKRVCAGFVISRKKGRGKAAVTYTIAMGGKKKREWEAVPLTDRLLSWENSGRDISYMDEGAKGGSFIDVEGKKKPLPPGRLAVRTTTTARIGRGREKKDTAAVSAG